MKHTTPLVILILFVIFSSLGCEAQNPVCTDNFCFVGEAFPRSELEAGQEFSEVDIDDSVIFATLIGATPVETTPAVETPVTETAQPNVTPLANIVADAFSGGTKYIDKTVTVVAPVRFNFKSQNTMTLFTGNEDVFFYVQPPTDLDNLNFFEEGKTYRISVYIDRIRLPDAQSGNYRVFSNLDKSTNPTEINPINVGMKKIVDDVASGGFRYLGKTIKINATVDFQINNLPSITLATNNPKVRFGVVSVKVDANNNSIKSTLNPYTQGNTYTFTLLIIRIKPPEGTKNYYDITADFVEAE